MPRAWSKACRVSSRLHRAPSHEPPAPGGDIAKIAFVNFGTGARASSENAGAISLRSRRQGIISRAFRRALPIARDGRSLTPHPRQQAAQIRYEDDEGSASLRRKDANIAKPSLERAKFSHWRGPPPCCEVRLVRPEGIDVSVCTVALVASRLGQRHSLGAEAEAAVEFHDFALDPGALVALHAAHDRPPSGPRFLRCRS